MMFSNAQLVSAGASHRGRARRLIAFVVVATGMSACASSAGPSTHMATSQTNVSLDARLLAMSDQRLRDTLLIDEVMHATNTVQRSRAALAIGQVQLRARYPLLRRLLLDADTAVAANAAFALGLAKDTLSIAALGRALSGAPDAVAREAAWAIGEIGEPARNMMLSALGDGTAQSRTGSLAAQRAPLIRAELLLAIVKLRQIPVATALPWLSDASVEVVRAAAYVIARPRLSTGLSAMLPLASYPDEEVRQHVARALTKATAGDSLATRARAVLQTLVSDSSPRVRANAARSLATFGPDVRRDLERSLADVDANVRAAAAENISTVFGNDVTAWQNAWDRDTTYMVRRTLLVNARMVGTAALRAAESHWAAASDWRLRAAVTDAQSQDPKSDRVAVGKRALSDPDGRVRAGGFALIAPRAAEDSTIRQLLHRALTDADMRVRATSATALRQSARADEVPSVLDAYALAQRDADGDARIAALRYLASAWERDSLRFDAIARARVAKLVPSSIAAERAVVQSVTPLARWKTIRNATRPLAEYERIAKRLLSPDAKMPQAWIQTERGTVTVELFGTDAPMVVDAFVTLANKGYYRDTRFHRVVPNFVAQDGDPRGDGTGGPGFALRDALTRQRHERGCFGLATSGPDTGGSQYYLCHAAQPHLNGHYTVFGRVLSGMDILDRIVQGDRVIRVDVR